MEAKGEAWDGHSWAVTGEKAGWWQILALRWQRTSGQPSPYTGSRTSRPPFQPEKSPAHTLPPRMLGPGLGLPRNVGLPAARSFPGNRQEAWLRVGLPAAGSRVGRAGPWGSEKGGSRKTRDCCCSFSLPQLRSGRGFIQRGKWAASPLHPAYCRSAFCTWLPETKPRPPIFFFFFYPLKYILEMCFCLVSIYGFLSFAWSLSSASRMVNCGITPSISLPRFITRFCCGISASGRAPQLSAHEHFHLAWRPPCEKPFSHVLPSPSLAKAVHLVCTYPSSLSLTPIFTFVPKGWSASCHLFIDCTFCDGVTSDLECTSNFLLLKTVL